MLEQRGAGAELTRSRPSRGAPSGGVQATPSWVRVPLRSPPGAHWRPDQGGRARGSGSTDGEGSANFRRVAIRRKSSVACLPPGTPRPWSRPPSQPRWAETAAVDAPGACLAGDGAGGGAGAAGGLAGRPAGAPDLRAARAAVPKGCAGPPLTHFVPSPKGPCLGRIRLGLRCPGGQLPEDSRSRGITLTIKVWLYCPFCKY